MEELQNTTNLSKLPRWLVLIISFVVPPFGWYLIWKEKRYHLLFPIILWFYSGFMFLLFCIIEFVVTPKMYTLYQEFNTAK